MKYCAIRLLLIVVSLTLLTDLSAQSTTLLWKIRKDGGKPSFLFGTMHISDKKAFNFRDSLYSYLQQAEAFALEFNPDSANQVIAAYMSGEFNQIDEAEPVDYSSPMPPDDTLNMAVMDTAVVDIAAIENGDDDSAASLAAPPIEIQQRSMVDHFIDRLTANKKRDLESMNTFMDAYLYEMAWQQGKRILGLEELTGKGEVIRALRTGLKARKSNKVLKQWDPVNEQSVIHRLYMKEDIDSLELYYREFFEPKALDIFLYNRNKDMVSRMDSIMQNQTLFAAVGSGHLAGAKGMIALLRKKGYSVEPVFSDKRIAAEEFQPDLNKRNWQLIKKDEYGFEFRLPGIAKTQDGEKGRKLVYNYDIGGGSLFMTSFGKLSSSEKGKSLHEIASTHLDEWLSNAGGRVLSKKSLVQDGLKAIEAICLYNDNSYYRYRELVKGNLFYILSIGSEKKDNLYTEKAEEYLNSFRTIPIPQGNWSTFHSSADGFSVLLPGKPQGEDVPLDETTSTTIAMKSYSWFDAASGNHYMVSPGKTFAGHFYPEGESFFESYINFIKEVSKEEPVVTDTILHGYPAKMFTGGSASDKLSGFILKRANTWYYVIAEYEAGEKSSADVDKFLHSFRTMAFEVPKWSWQQSPHKDFRVWLPGPIVLEKQDSNAYNFKSGNQQFYGHDPFASISYHVDVYPISKYYWAPNLDSVYNSLKDRMVNKWNDSLLKFSTIKNGGLEGREIWKTDKTGNNRTVMRLLLNGDTMYVLNAAWPYSDADEKNLRRFFDEFRVSHEESPATILGNDPRLLFADLQSKDSARFQEAYTALDEVQFLQKDIMLMMEKAMLPYPASANNYFTVNDKLLQQALQFFKENDSTAYRKPVIDFIRENYTKKSAVIDSIRFNLLGIIASDKTRESYQLLTELLATGHVMADHSYHLFYKLYDSLALTSTLYPGLLNYLSDSTMSLPIASLTKTLIDSNQLSRDVLLPVKKELLELARKQKAKLIKEDVDNSYDVPDLVELLGYLKQKDADDAVAGFLKINDNRIKKTAALVLVKNKRPVSSAVIRAIANDPQYRVELYESLKKLQMEKLFPADHRSQVGLAESYIFTAVFDEEEDYTRPEIIFIKKMEYEYKGARKVFYIFRANYEYENPEEGEGDDARPLAKVKESYFTVAGPFDINKSILTIDEKENISGGWYEEKFDGMKNDYFFRKYIEQRLKWQKENKQ